MNFYFVIVSFLRLIWLHIVLHEKLTLCVTTNHISSLNRMYSVIEDFIPSVWLV